MVRKVSVFLLLAVVLVFAAATAASSATFTFTNEFNVRIAITLTYTDADSGALTTRGWWHVEPGGRTAITVNADESRDVYYAAYNEVQFVDSSTLGNPQIRRWASRRTFRYATDAEPSDHDAWHGRFYRINGRAVNIDASR